MNEEHLQQIGEEIFKTGKIDREWMEDQPEEDFTEEYKKGWKEGIDQLVTELLGRQEEDKVEKLKELINE